LEFGSPVDSQQGRLEIVGTGSGAFHIGTASLMPADNMHGFHGGMVRLFREAGFKMLKWPGGNFVSGYDWYDGIGDVDKRPPRHQAMWNNRVESNDVGIHEFIAFNVCSGRNPISRSTADSEVLGKPPRKWRTATVPPTPAWDCARKTAIPSRSTFAFGPIGNRCMVRGSSAACR
jgi:hypothetical protein